MNNWIGKNPRWTLIFFGLILTSLCYAQKNKQESKHAIFNNGPIKGMTLSMHSEDYDFNYEELVDEVVELGTDWIQVNVKFYQNNIYSDSIHIPESDSYFWEQLAGILAHSKKHNLHVGLMPIVLLLESPNGEWRGKLAPNSKDKWYASYLKMISEISNLSSKYNLDFLTIGTEYSSMQDESNRWMNIINAARKKYSGAISYSANWDNYENIGFVSELDFLGISGYFELTEKLDPSRNELIAGWRPVKEKILRVQSQIKIPIIFSELGYTSQNGANQKPWNYTLSKDVDLQEQVDCYEAFIETWSPDLNFNGVFFYDWFSEGGLHDTGYTIKDKPAQAVVQGWFCN